MDMEKDRRVRARAYDIWVEGGRRTGLAEEDWLQAEREHELGSEAAFVVPPESGVASAHPGGAADEALAKSLPAEPVGARTAASKAGVVKVSSAKTAGAKSKIAALSDEDSGKPAAPKRAAKAGSLKDVGADG